MFLLDRDCLNSSTIGLLPTLIRYKTSFLMNLISKPLYTLFAVFLRPLSGLERLSLSVLLSKVYPFVLPGRAGRNNGLLTSLSFSISRLQMKGLVIENGASCQEG